MKKLTKARALTIARRKWGKRAIVDDRGRRHGPSSPEQREVASAALKLHREQKPVFLPLDEWDGNELIGEYRRALAAHNAAYRVWKQREDELRSTATYYRYQVGSDNGWAFYVQGSGDTWEEALTKAGVPLVVKADE
jgi:hypothetical protein